MINFPYNQFNIIKPCAVAYDRCMIKQSRQVISYGLFSHPGNRVKAV